MIIQAISTWEPRVVIESLDVFVGLDSFSTGSVSFDDPRTDSDHVLGIKITFVDPEQIQEVQELELKIPLGG
jgi:alkylation response protein AidB-like acyl-CoA dehydrogenase